MKYANNEVIMKMNSVTCVEDGITKRSLEPEQICRAQTIVNYILLVY